MAAYATAADLMKRKDVRVLGDLVSDNSVRVKKPDLSTDENLLAALMDASGEIEAAVLQAKRYTTDQLAALTGNSKQYLISLTCTIAFGLLHERRTSNDEDDGGREEAQKRARQALESLRKGQTIFDVEEVKEAGLPSTHEPTVTSIQNLNLTVNEARGHFYPRQLRPRR